jgi:hypothetical protein
MSCVAMTEMPDENGEHNAHEPVPAHECPKCTKTVLDFDGFGFIACPWCDFCTHPSSTSDQAGNMVCDICRKVTGQVIGPVKAARGWTDGGGI